MISFRFHLVSLVAVFLALGLGVLTGTTVLNRGIVSQLERQTDQLAGQSSALRETVRDLEVEREMWNRFGDGVFDRLVEGRLQGVEVVVITQEGTAPEGIDATRDALERSGAIRSREVTIAARMGLEDPEDLATLAGLVGAEDPTSAADVGRQTAERLADQIAFGTAGTDFLGSLQEAGLLAVDDLEDPGDAGEGAERAERLYVLVAGGEPDPPLEPEAFLVHLTERLALDGQRVAAVETSTSEVLFIEMLRRGPVADRMLTLDNVEAPPGSIGLVLGAQALVAGGEGGHYGVKPGASSLLPAP